MNASTDEARLSVVNTRLQGFWTLASWYSDRQLTYESDALRALSGICRVFEQGAHPLQNLRGLAVVVLAKVQEDQDTFRLVSALGWDHFPPILLIARKEFPSWTWAGWTSKMLYPYLSNMLAYFEVSKVVKLECEDGQSLTLTELARSLASWGFERVSQQILPETSQGDATKQNRPTVRKSLINPVVTHHDLFFPDQMTFVGGRFLDVKFDIDEGTWTKMTPFSSADFYGSLSAGRTGVILLCTDCGYFDDSTKNNLSHRAAHLLLLEWREGKKGEDARHFGRLTARVSTGKYLDMDVVMDGREWIDVRLH